MWHPARGVVLGCDFVGASRGLAISLRFSFDKTALREHRFKAMSESGALLIVSRNCA